MAELALILETEKELIVSSFFASAVSAGRW